MKYFKYIFVLVIAFFILWIDVPGQIPIKFSIFGKKIDTHISALVFEIKIGDKTFKKEIKTQLGLDLKGGSYLIFETDTSGLKPEDVDDAVTSARNIVEQRVNMFGVSEPEVRTVKSGNEYRIEVGLPGVSDVAQASALIGQTAQLQFKEKGEENNPLATQSAALAFLDLQKDTGLTGDKVEKATVVFDNQNGQPQVQLEFTNEGKKLFAEITKRNIGEPVGIFLDNLLISAPTVQQEITEGNAVISGSFTVEEAKQLATAINSGALPVPIELTQQKSIGPSLGKIEVQKSIAAGVVGLVMVMIFMISYYGRLGIIACTGLIIYGLINFAIFRFVPIVLTLPGIAGFLLSIGMAVDSNILIFERIKEEQRKGKPFSKALNLGFGRAIDAIKDANVTTLLVAFILFNPLGWDFLPQFGMIRGFALTLAIGVATSLFTGVFVTKWLLKTFYTKK